MRVNACPGVYHQYMRHGHPNSDAQNSGATGIQRTRIPRAYRDIIESLVEQLRDGTEDRIMVLRQLAFIYDEIGHYGQAIEFLKITVIDESELESKAARWLAMGAIAEKAERFEEAVHYYRNSVALEPEKHDAWYFAHNNLGFCLNRLDQFVEGEKFCRTAIDIDPMRPNAHKNLGVAFEGQGRIQAAARCYVQANRAEPEDIRALGLLKNLLQRHPELDDEFGREIEQ